ncbi:MAG: asparagine synthase C-terminal domain-containing protein [Saprospiraceae bacterium]|nr:asparagine synthase C-terminal domain-containing protein [Saprospiraceae bacterium]
MKNVICRCKEETLRLFNQAVTRQMIADVPVGSYLSGGMDSGSIVSVASSHVPRLTTFTCGFDMSEVTGVEANYDERRDAELLANHFKTEHYEQVMNAGDLRWSLPKVVNHLEDLRVGMSYPNYYISRLASKFVKVFYKEPVETSFTAAIHGDITGYLTLFLKKIFLINIIVFGRD